MIRWEMWIHVFVMWFLVNMMVNFVIHDSVIIEWNCEVEVISGMAANLRSTMGKKNWKPINPRKFGYDVSISLVVFLMIGMLMLSAVGIKFVPLFKSSMRLGWRLMLVKLCILLVEDSFSFSACNCDFLVRLFSMFRRRAVFWSQRSIRDWRWLRKLFRSAVRLLMRLRRK